MRVPTHMTLSWCTWLLLLIIALMLKSPTIIARNYLVVIATVLVYITADVKERLQ